MCVCVCFLRISCQVGFKGNLSWNPTLYFDRLPRKLKGQPGISNFPTWQRLPCKVFPQRWTSHSFEHPPPTFGRVFNDLNGGGDLLGAN